jgi:ligand-binding SRPBCC domain-containing protein
LRRIIVSAHYAVPALTVWSHVVRYDSLQAVMSGPLVAVRCPEGEEQVGHDVALTFRLFGVVPIGGWRLKVLARDDNERRLLSQEEGTAVRYWRHEIKVESEGEGSRLTDTITVDAGPLTPLIAAFARRDYTRRHRLRKRMLGG